MGRNRKVWNRKLYQLRVGVFFLISVRYLPLDPQRREESMSDDVEPFNGASLAARMSLQYARKSDQQLFDGTRVRVKASLAKIGSPLKKGYTRDSLDD